jgi:exonuclease SbcC
MIPLHLRLAGFLSYRDPTELDFTTFDLACISGPNGAGKSSLLDALTWALFGEARAGVMTSSTLSGCKSAEAIDLQHGENTVQRTLPRNKSTVLEFQIQNTDEWKPLTEKTTRDTQARIEQTLRLEYETFVNASFFLQGKADQFTQQNAGKRKDVATSWGLAWMNTKIAPPKNENPSNAKWMKLSGVSQRSMQNLARKNPAKQGWQNWNPLLHN